MSYYDWPWRYTVIIRLHNCFDKVHIVDFLDYEKSTAIMKSRRPYRLRNCITNRDYCITKVISDNGGLFCDSEFYTIDNKNYRLSRFFVLSAHTIIRDNARFHELKQARDAMLARKQKRIFREHVTEELMAKIWHPKNMKKFRDWGVDEDE